MPEETNPKQSWAGLLREAGKQLIPVLLTAGSLLGFVAFAGGVIVWTRFSAAKVPPDQAVNAVPRDELVAIGSALLLLFGFFGVLALVGVFLIDRGARATPGMARALLAFFLVEGVTTIIIVDGLSAERTGAIAALFALPIAVALWATFVASFVELEDDLPTREGERPGPRGYGMFLLPGPSSSGGWLAWLWAYAPIPVAIVGVVVGVIVDAGGSSDVCLLVWLGASIFALVFLALLRAHFAGRPVREKLDRERDAFKAEAGLGLPEAWRWSEESRLLNERPMRLELRFWGVVLMVLSLVVAVGVPWWRLGEWWVAVAIGAAAALTGALWRISALSARRVVWYGVAVFLSVPLFGTLTAMARNVADPQVQPMALIRTTDGPDEAIQGLYVTEADERVYFATVATEGCGNELTSHSGRLAWVPKSEVVAMSVGPLQDVGDAGDSALEMAYALTPAVETPAGGEATLTVSEKQAGGTADAVAAPTQDKRLEDTGPAVRPNFGAGLRLIPEDASPGDEVTLLMSAPNKDVEGFGRTRNGRTVRVGGVRAKIVKEQARSAEGAEYVETWSGRLLKLAKGEPFVRKPDGHFAPLAEVDGPHGPRQYLKLADPAAFAVADQTVARQRRYLELAPGEGSGPPRLADPGQTVVLTGTAGGAGAFGPRPRVRLRQRPLGQAWHEREIRFEVPENASTGAIAVECSQLAGQPLLRVAHAPEARVSVRMEAGSSRVTFDSSRSDDVDDESISRRWDVAGLRRGNQPTLSTDLPPRPRAYEVSLTTTDESGRTDTVEIQLLRLPASLFRFNRDQPRHAQVLKGARKSLMRVVGREPPAAIEIDGHADDPGTSRYNVRLSLRRAEHVRDRLLRLPTAGVGAGYEIPVRTLAYGESCPVDPRSGPRPRNRRVDVFVFHKGVSMAPPAGCHPRRFQSSEWVLPPARHPAVCEEESAAVAGGWEWLLIRAAVKAVERAFGFSTASPAAPANRRCPS